LEKKFKGNTVSVTRIMICIFFLKGIIMDLVNVKNRFLLTTKKADLSFVAKKDRKWRGIHQRRSHY